MDAKTHKATIERLSSLTEQRRAIAAHLVSKMNLRVVLFGGIEKRTAQRKALLGLFLRESDRMYTGVSKLGKDFAQVKIGN
jgi:hypothetical protein